MPANQEKNYVVNVVCPSVEELQSEENGQCVCSLCGRVISNSSALKLHLVKTHRMGDVKQFEKGGDKSRRKTVYRCPVVGCPRGSMDLGRHFKNIWHVRQHYLNCHAERKQECSKCHAKFGTINRLRQHEKNCGRIFTCSCGCPFTTREALLTHARIQGHSGNMEPVLDKSHGKTTNRKDITQQTSSSRKTQQRVQFVSAKQNSKVIQVPMLLLMKNHDSSKSNRPRFILPTTTVNKAINASVQPNTATLNYENSVVKTFNVSRTSDNTPARPLTTNQSNQTTASVCMLHNTVDNTSSCTGTSEVEPALDEYDYDVSDAFTQTKEQTYGNQFSQTGSSYSELAENQTQTLSLVDLLEYHQLNDAFTQTSTTDRQPISTQSEQSNLSEIETQTTSEIMDFLQENVTDAFTQTLQHGNNDQCSQTTSSLFKMMTGTTQTRSFASFQDLASSIDTCTDTDYNLLTNDEPFVDNTNCPADDPLNDAFTQTWSQCSNDQFSQTNWSGYIHSAFLDKRFSPVPPATTTKSVDSNCDAIECSSGDTPSRLSERIPTKICSDLLDSCTQTTVSFNTMIDLALEEDSRDLFTPPYLADAGTQTPLRSGTPY